MGQTDHPDGWGLYDLILEDVDGKGLEDTTDVNGLNGLYSRTDDDYVNPEDLI